MLQSVQFTQPPPPVIPNLSVPPPMPPPHFPQHRFHGDRGGHRGHYFQPFRPYPRPGPGGPDSEFDGKRLRKSVMRKTVDYNSAIIKMLECRVWQRDFRDRRALQPDVLYYPDLQPPPSYVDNPINSVTTRFVKTATNKMRCPIFCMAWTPEGRRLVTGASSGEFTLWNGLTFNFETILQAHDSPVRTMVWSHNDVWMVTGDHAGYVKYWQSNMNNVKMFQAHKEAIRGLSFSPTDHKFVTCSDDGTLRIWDFMRCHEERILRGHGADVKCCHWHPQKGLIVSGSKDNQQPVKLWDPKTGQSLATLHAHKSTVMDIKWNANGNWLVTASRDHLLKLFDLRNLSQEVQTFRGHKKEASSVAWHPYHEGLFCSGGSDGAILFWHVGADKEVGGIEQAHDSIVWTLAWHPLGHILCSGSNDHTSKFWTRNRPGDLMRDKYNLNTLPAGLPGIDDQDIDEPAVIPGMGPEDKVETVANQATAQIPGLDFEGVEDRQKQFHKKVPYSKPIPRNFQAQWNETGRGNQEDGMDEDSDEDDSWRSRRQALIKDPITEVITQLIETNPPPGVVPLSQLQPQAIILFGKLVPVEGNPTLAQAIADGPEALNRLIKSGEIEELQDVMPFVDDGEYEYNEDDMDLETMSDIELPAPLPSSVFAKKNSDTLGNSGTVPGERVRKSRFSDLPESASAQPPRLEHNNADRQNTVVMKPMDNATPSKSVGDEDMRMLQMKAPIFPAPDQDMRFVQGDIDLRQPPHVSVPLTGDQDFRRIQTDSDLRQVGGDGRFPLDEDLRLGSVDQDLRSVPGPLQPMPMGSVPFGSDSDFRQSSGIPPLLPRPSQLSPSGRTRDVDGRSPHFGPGVPQFSGRQRGLLPLMEMDSWSGPRKRRWGDADHDDDEEEQLSGQGNPGHFGRPGAFGSTRTGAGGSFGPPGRDFVSGRGSPGGNFGPARGLSPSTNFGPDRGNFSDIRGGGPDGMYGHLSGDDSYGPPEEIDNMRGNFGRGLLRGGSFGPDVDRGDGYPSEDELDNEDMDSFGQGNGHDWSGSFSGHGRGSYQGQYPYSMEPGYPKRGSGGRGFTRGRSSFSRGGMRSGQRGRFPTGRGRGGRGSQKHSKERGKF
ncbi:pre-mRNA 3' end processing protein WDR33 [Anabrus simplex]|uniref:pre-mRNA 3' end processing protein WDR33 n=1 Tax=Anabrus simplex TaxID=316456 RepID=UPI0034DCC515